MALLTTRAPLETLDKDELIATVRRLLTEADALSSRISAVNEIGIAMNRTLDLATIERVIAKQAKWLLDFDHLSVCLPGASPTDWRITTLFGAPEPQPADWNAADNLMPVLHSGQPKLIQRGIDSPFMQPYASQLIMPLSADDLILGTINFGAVEPDVYSMDDMRIAYMLSLQLSSALRNARILDELQRTQRELQLRVEELDAYSRTIAHDLKSPLSGILLWAELLQLKFGAQMPSEAIEFTKSIHKSGRIMNRMIDQLLMLAKIRHTTETMQPVDVSAVLGSVMLRLKTRIDGRGVQIAIAPDLPPVVGYAQWVEEVFANLIGNAVKYIGDANPNPCVEVLAEPAGENTVRYTVRDNGIGIAKEDQARLFEAFSPAHRAESEGVGLGLSITQRMIQKMNGTIGVDSQPGKGSAFWFTLRAANSTA